MRKILSFVMALVLGFTFASAETVTLYCKVTQGWWTSDDAAVALHCWGGTGETSWPGVRMSPVEGEEGLWVATMDKSNTGFMFVRVNGSGDVSDWGAKTANLSLPEDDKDLYTITSSSAVWGDPGVTGEWSKYEPAGEQGGEGGESGEGGEEGGEGGEEQPVENVNVFFVNVPGWAAVNAYAWDAQGPKAVWPGEAMTKTEAKVNEKDVFSFALPKNFVNIIFNNGTDQTGDLTVDAAKPYFYDGAWYANAEAIPAAGGEGGEEGGEGGEEQPVENVNVFFVNVPGWEAVNAYAWKGEGEAVVNNAAWPGVAMTKTDAKVNEKEVYSVAVAADMVNIIFNNGADQTADQALDAAKPYFCDGKWYATAAEIPAAGEGGEGEGGEGGEAQPAETVTVFFVNVPGWEAVNAYAWTGEVKNAEWPGEAMTPVNTQINDKNVYSITLAKSFVNIIFNNGTDQTPDQTIDAAKPYFYDGVWYAKAEDIPAAGGEGGEEGGEGGEAQPAETVTVFFVNVPGWEAVNAYAWTGEVKNAEWPGEAMTPVNTQINDKNVYSITLAKSFVNIIFNNGTDQTPDQTIDAAKPYFYDGVWYAKAEEIPAAGEAGEGGEQGEGLANGFYLIGQNGWDIAALNSNLLFTANPGADNEFNLVVTLEEGQSLKVVKVENNAIAAWYPDGMDNEYKVDAEHAGNRTIYFQETYKEEWAAFGGFFFISSDVTAIDNINSDVKAVKFIENGQLFIIVNTRVFNAAGQLVR